MENAAETQHDCASKLEFTTNVVSTHSLAHLIFPMLWCHHRARRSFWTCLKMSTGAWRLVGLHCHICFFFSPINETWLAWVYRCVCGVAYVCLTCVCLQSKPLNVEYLMMDASVLLPPTGTPLTGIDFVKRLPCGDVEKTRRVRPNTSQGLSSC